MPSRRSGNYGEIYDRHLGKDSPVQLPRGLNDLWTRGGLMVRRRCGSLTRWRAGTAASAGCGPRPGAPRAPIAHKQPQPVAQRLRPGIAIERDHPALDIRIDPEGVEVQGCSRMAAMTARRISRSSRSAVVVVSGCGRSTARSRSARLTIPTSLPSCTTGTRRIWCFSMSWAMCSGGGFHGRHQRGRHHVARPCHAPWRIGRSAASGRGTCRGTSRAGRAAGRRGGGSGRLR